MEIVIVNAKASCLRYLSTNTIPTGNPLNFGRGAYVWDIKGTKYLDFASQTLNLNLGHAHPAIVKAVKEQLYKIPFCSSRFWDEQSLLLAQKLCSIAPVKRPKVNLRLNGGTEANEDAIKRMWARHGAEKKILSFEDSMLGVSFMTQAASGRYGKMPYDIESERRRFSFINRPLSKLDEQQALDAIEHQFSMQTCAGILFEPVAVNAGVVVHSRHFLKKIQLLCRKYGVACALDEIQTGFGWLGAMFASTYFRLSPDILTLSKSLASGFPLGATIFARKYDILEYYQSEHTYGGHATASAAAVQISLFSPAQIC